MGPRRTPFGYAACLFVASIVSGMAADDAPGASPAWPVAEAGPDQVVFEGALVTFNGSASTDDVGVVNYTWTLTDVVAVKLYGVQPARRFATPGVFAVALKVLDADGHWGDDTMNVTVKAIPLPVADAGPDMTVAAGYTVVFGAATGGNCTIDRCCWNFTYDGKPQGLEGATVPFKFDHGGVYEVLLTVFGGGHNATDRVKITVVDTGKVSGTVLNKYGTPVYDALVRITASDGRTYTARTDYNGSFMMAIYQGPYDWSISKDGYHELRGSSSVAAMAEDQLPLSNRPLEEYNPDATLTPIQSVVVIAAVALFMFSGGIYRSVVTSRDRKSSARAVFFLDQVNKIVTQNGWELKSADEELLVKSWGAQPSFTTSGSPSTPAGVEPPPAAASEAKKRFKLTYRDPEGDTVRVDYYHIWHWRGKESDESMMIYVAGKPSSRLMLLDFVAGGPGGFQLVNEEKLSSEIWKRFGAVSLGMGKLVPRKCPSCGATTEAPVSQDSVKCEYCENVFEVKDGKETQQGADAAAKAAAGPAAGAAAGAAPAEHNAPAMTPEERQEKLEQLEERLLEGKISEATYLDLKKKYEDG